MTAAAGPGSVGRNSTGRDGTGTIGIAGVGNVGAALALALAGAGVPVLLLPPRSGVPGRVAHLETVPTARDLAARCDVVLTCLRGSDEVAGLLPDLLAGARGRPGFLHVDHGNGDPARDAEFAAAWKAQGQLYSDAALLGPPERLPGAKVRLLAGGEAGAVEKLRAVSAPYCDDFIHAGAVGRGHMLRLVVSLMGYGIAALSAEIVATAGAAGIAPELVRAAIGGKSLDTETFQTVVAAAISPDAEVRRLPIANVRRDLARLAAAAPGSGPRNLMGEALGDFYARADGDGGEPVMISDLAARLSRPAFRRARDAG